MPAHAKTRPPRPERESLRALHEDLVEDRAHSLLSQFHNERSASAPSPGSLLTLAPRKLLQRAQRDAPSPVKMRKEKMRNEEPTSLADVAQQANVPLDVSGASLTRLRVPLGLQRGLQRKERAWPPAQECPPGETGCACGDGESCAAGLTCENGTCATPPAPDPVDVCANNPCNNGSCQSSAEGYLCSCDAGWTGANCSQPVENGCDDSPCTNGTCTDLPGGDYSCACDSGWSGPNCDTNIDDCASHPCNNGTCTDGVDSYTCTCDAGWEGDDCDIGRLPRPALSPATTVGQEKTATSARPITIS